MNSQHTKVIYSVRLTDQCKAESGGGGGDNSEVSNSVGDVTLMNILDKIFHE